MVNSFIAPAEWPQTLIVRLADDCGLPVLNAQMVASFSNGDPPLAMQLTNPQVGLYSATWSPSSSSAQVRILAQASAPDLGTASAAIIGQVLSNQAPALSPDSVLSDANPVTGAPLAPGAIADISGVSLAGAAQTADGAPLPNALGGTTVLIGAIEAPLFFVSPDTLRIQVPLELVPNRSYTVVAGANGAYTLPATITVASAAPAILADSNGMAFAQDGSAAPISEASPAHPGSAVTIFLEGMGLTSPEGVTGSGADGAANVQIPPTVSVGGETANILYAGLAPTLIGVYQIDFQVPADAPSGDLSLSVTQGGVVSNSAVLPVR